jgi:ATP-dependent DNA helicase RecQ
MNNPLADSKLAKELFIDLVEKYKQFPENLRKIYFNLLHDRAGFSGFFELYPEEKLPVKDLVELINQEFIELFCSATDKIPFIERYPVELAYVLALISTKIKESISPPWLINNFPKITEIIKDLRLANCFKENCLYCSKNLNIKSSLYNFFTYNDFRRFESDEGEPLQEKVVKSGIKGESFLTIFPTGGGKSLTFQLPALIHGEACRSLTVVISPLQSLMKDQVDVLKKRFDNTRAVTINGLLSPLERSDAIQKVQEGGAFILYISPESLRSPTIFKLLQNRNISRFVIDEAHSFSAWGQDFRVDYLYIGEFLKKLGEAKGLEKPVPVSCFTATAKLSVIEDIINYFKEKLGLDLEIFTTASTRKNLHYSVFNTPEEKVKYQKLKNLLMEKEGPKIVYVSRTKTTEKLAEKLRKDNFNALAYHGKMESEQKIEAQNSFMEGEADIIVATSAFGMGVDKDNVGMVIHYEISSSLENYVQEAGRAGRNELLNADCYILFDEKDLDAHFELLNRSKLNHKEISQIWKGIKEFKTETFSKSALEIARAAGWDYEMQDCETRVRAAINALEDCGYLKRGLNSTRLFADSFLIRDVNTATRKIESINNISGQDKMNAKRIFQSMVTYNETAVDELSAHLGLSNEDIIRSLNIMKENEIIGDHKDLTASINTSNEKKSSRKLFHIFCQLEKTLLDLIKYETANTTKRIYLNDINEQVIEAGVTESNSEAIRTILRFWSHKNLINTKRLENNAGYHVTFKPDKTEMIELMNKRLSLASSVLDYLQSVYDKQDKKSNPALLEFSMLGIKNNIEQNIMFAEPQWLDVYEEILLYLHEIGSVKLEGGLLVYYNPLNIERLEMNNKKTYTKEDYKKLELYYEQKVEQIHIVAEYARKMHTQYEEAMQFVNDYFTLEYETFIRKYFPNRRVEIKRALTEEKFKEIFGALSTEQLDVIRDDSKNILVIAGPGSGKTRILVHKVASLLMMEDIKPEQFLMLTFSRPAALEFRKRLSGLVSKLAYGVDIYTYHSLAFSIMGRLGSLEKSEGIINQATDALRKNENPGKRIDYKSVLVVDEYQDIGEQEFNFLKEIIDQAGEIRVIVVGDDDQNIYEFRGSSIKYMKSFREFYDAKLHYLSINFRSKANIVDFTNQFISPMTERLKSSMEMRPFTTENGLIKINYFGNLSDSSNRLITPLVRDIVAFGPKESTAVLTATNEEAMLVHTLLKEKNIPAKLVMTNTGFDLKNIIEVKTFSSYIFQENHEQIGLITDEVWEKAKLQIQELFKNSINLPQAMLIIETFEFTNPKKFQSEFRNYLNELRIEDLYHPDKNYILVSTMHKAKGKEFENVFLLLEHFKINRPEKQRVLYVAMTRAKTNLLIYTNQQYLNHLKTENLIKNTDNTQYDPPTLLFKQTALDDINLGNYKKYYNSDRLKKLFAGDPLFVKDWLILDKNRAPLLSFSKKFNGEINRIFSLGYKIKEISIGFIVVWFDSESSGEYRTALPKIIFEKINEG